MEQKEATNKNAEKTTWNLIDSSMSKEETIELIQNLYRQKIQFNRIKNFRSIELSGKEDQEAMHRIIDLEKNLSLFLKTSNLIDDSEILNVKANISISK